MTEVRCGVECILMLPHALCMITGEDVKPSAAKKAKHFRFKFNVDKQDMDAVSIAVVPPSPC